MDLLRNNPWGQGKGGLIVDCRGAPGDHAGKLEVKLFAEVPRGWKRHQFIMNSLKRYRITKMTVVPMILKAFERSRVAKESP